MRFARLIGPELRTLLQESPAEVTELLNDIHPEDIADIIAEFEKGQAAEVITQLPTEYAAKVFERLDEPLQAQLAKAVGQEATAALLVEMDADERADFFEDLPQEVGETLLRRIKKLDPEAAEELLELGRWPENSAGGLMTTEYISVEPGLTMEAALAEIRAQAKDAETVDTIFVLEPSEHIVGILPVRSVLLSDPTQIVADVMHGNIISVTPELDQEDVAHTLGKYDLNAMPVVTTEGQMLGVITADDVLDVLQDEQSEDVQRLGAVEPIHSGYFETSIGMLLRKRAPWLLALFVGGFFTASAMMHFDGILQSVAILTVYVPLLISAGGNSGSQSSTLITRGLALGEIRSGDWWRVFLRELAQGLVLGCILAALGVARVLMGGEHGALGVGLFAFSVLIGVTLVGIVVMGCLEGGMMPILLNRLGLDPATSSTPFIATIVDVFGIVLYLSLAQIALGELVSAAPPGVLTP